MVSAGLGTTREGMIMSGAWKNIAGGVTAPRGYLASSAACGIKKSRRRDLALLFTETPASWAAVLTTNRAPAAPVLLARERLRRRLPLQAVIINSGNANAATGSEGMRNARKVVARTAALLNIPPSAVLPSSTGIIGVQLPVERIEEGLPSLVAALSRRGGRAAAEGIMTTDTRRKETAVEVELSGGKVRVGGMAKGAGMIHPRMATMLAFIATDAAVETAVLRKALRESVEGSFNRISIDGDRSTNDTALVMANGASGVAAGSRSDRELFGTALQEVCRRLAEMIVRDGEGATKFVEVAVTGARSDAEALRAARAVANSSLVKTALYGHDLNWGRILAALGYSGASIDVSRISISVNGCPAVRQGVAVDPGEGRDARLQMRRRDLKLSIDLGLGRGRDRMLTCDLTIDYVKENALYTT